MTECACFLMTETLLTPREMEDDVTGIYKWSPPPPLEESWGGLSREMQSREELDIVCAPKEKG